MKKNSQEIQDLKQGWQRCVADFENFKKRTLEEKANWSRIAKIEILEQILPILDNLNLASTHTPADLKDNQWAQGINHIAKHIEDSFTQLGIEKITPKAGEKFDHKFHEATAVEKSKNHPEGTIVSVKSAGFSIEGVLIRPAKVVVSKDNE